MSLFSHDTYALNRSVLRLAVPSILANITIPLVGIVDVAICGHIADASAIGGIAIGTMLFDLLYWNFGFLRVGTSGLTAQAYGRGDMPAAAAILRDGLAVAGVASLLIWAIQWLFVTGVLWCTPCSEEVAAFASRYFYVRIWAAPATLMLMAFKGWFIGMHNTVAPMVTDIVVNVVNMAASYYLAVYTPLSAIGVAWGTLIAQYTGLLTAFAFLFISYRSLFTVHSTQAPGRSTVHFTQVIRLSSFQLQLIARSLCFMVIYVGYTALASDYGDLELSVSAILMKLFLLFSYFADGFAYAGEAMAGSDGAQADGSWRRNAKVDRLVRVLSMWSLLIGGVFTLLFAFWGDGLIALMTSDLTIRSAAVPYRVWLILMPLVSSFAFMWDGIYIGATNAVSIRNCMIAAAIAFIAAYAAFHGLLGIHALYLGYFLHLLVRSLYLTLRYPSLGRP